MDTELAQGSHGPAPRPFSRRARIRAAYASCRGPAFLPCVRTVVGRPDPWRVPVLWWRVRVLVVGWILAARMHSRRLRIFPVGPRSWRAPAFLRVPGFWPGARTAVADGTLGACQDSHDVPEFLPGHALSSRTHLPVRPRSCGCLDSCERARTLMGTFAFSRRACIRGRKHARRVNWCVGAVGVRGGRFWRRVVSPPRRIRSVWPRWAVGWAYLRGCGRSGALVRAGRHRRSRSIPCARRCADSVLPQ